MSEDFPLYERLSKKEPALDRAMGRIDLMFGFKMRYRVKAVLEQVLDNKPGDERPHIVTTPTDLGGALAELILLDPICSRVIQDATRSTIKLSRGIRSPDHPEERIFVELA